MGEGVEAEEERWALGTVSNATDLAAKDSSSTLIR
jgi:hypothetical protein